jgi:hypothetical protein
MCRPGNRQIVITCGFFPSWGAAWPVVVGRPCCSIFAKPGSDGGAGGRRPFLAAWQRVSAGAERYLNKQFSLNATTAGSCVFLSQNSARRYPGLGVVCWREMLAGVASGAWRWAALGPALPELAQACDQEQGRGNTRYPLLQRQSLTCQRLAMLLPRFACAPMAGRGTRHRHWRSPARKRRLPLRAQRRRGRAVQHGVVDRRALLLGDWARPSGRDAPPTSSRHSPPNGHSKGAAGRPP